MEGRVDFCRLDTKNTPPILYILLGDADVSPREGGFVCEGGLNTNAFLSVNVLTLFRPGVRTEMSRLPPIASTDVSASDGGPEKATRPLRRRTTLSSSATISGRAGTNCTGQWFLVWPREILAP